MGEDGRKTALFLSVVSFGINVLLYPNSYLHFVFRLLPMSLAGAYFMTKKNFDIQNLGMKEMFANYGLAMMRASFVEKTLMLLLVAINQIGKQEVPPDEFSSVLFADDRKTFGQLLKKLKTQISLSEDLEKEIEEALSNRNFLAHHFFFQNREALLVGNPSSLSKELQQLGTSFVRLQPKIDTLLEKFMKQWKIPYEKVNQEVKALLKRNHS